MWNGHGMQKDFTLASYTAIFGLVRKWTAMIQVFFFPIKKATCNHRWLLFCGADGTRTKNIIAI